MGKRKGLSPTQRTLAALRARGCQAAVVEKWNPFGGARVVKKEGQSAEPVGVRQDLFGFIDILAVEPGKMGCLGVQCCAGSGVAAHLDKIRGPCHDEVQNWLIAGNRLEVHGWRKVKLQKGGLAMRWAVRVVEVTLVNLEQEND